MGGILTKKYLPNSLLISMKVNHNYYYLLQQAHHIEEMYNHYMVHNDKPYWYEEDYQPFFIDLWVYEEYLNLPSA